MAKSDVAQPDIIIPPVAAPLPTTKRWKRDLTPASAFQWLALGWQDFRTQPGPSIVYGFLIFLLSAAIVGGLFRFELDYILFPALAGFMVVGPILAVGPYAKSRLLAAGQPVSLSRMIFVHPASGAQIMFTGVLLCMLMLLWMRAAVIIYALFFGLVAFPGLDHVAPMLFATPTGWATECARWRTPPSWSGSSSPEWRWRSVPCPTCPSASIPTSPPCRSPSCSRPGRPWPWAPTTRCCSAPGWPGSTPRCAPHTT